MQQRTALGLWCTGGAAAAHHWLIKADRRRTVIGVSRKSWYCLVIYLYPISSLLSLKLTLDPGILLGWCGSDVPPSLQVGLVRIWGGGSVAMNDKLHKQFFLFLTVFCSCTLLISLFWKTQWPLLLHLTLLQVTRWPSSAWLTNLPQLQVRHWSQVISIFLFPNSNVYKITPISLFEVRNKSQRLSDFSAAMDTLISLARVISVLQITH